ncbi:hypothetical protein [Leptolyngbya sp. FACHB-16]|uniref:hypothetical protein n=1 Tax=unclassified Leptolyngbya TaxID=2650499 RepID=UPI001682DE87|nr:hypothetical protein [Leptolyngbya sp. FACHB-16]MBD2156016.1 hypothetical protein [Leptolyngbya sp. FACHB-16]
MKKHLVWVASASILSFLPAIPAHAQIDRPAQCEEYVSYYLLPNGNCLNLTVFTELGSLYGQLEDLNREATPITARNLRLYSENRLVFLSGQLINQSSRSLWVNSATFSFTRRVDGRTETYATVEVPVLQRIASGQTGDLDKLVDVRGYPTTTIRLMSVNAWE